MASSSLEKRLRKLEIQLGLDAPAKVNQNTPSDAAVHTDLITRLQALEQRYQESPLMKNNASLEQSWKESLQLLREFDPGPALTHQQQNAVAPILYRQQAILAQAEPFKRDLQQVSQILHWLLMEQQELSSGIVNESQVTQAPIVTATAAPVSEQDRQRLEALEGILSEIKEQVQRLADRLDSLLNKYQALMSAASERMVLADEQVRLCEQQQTTKPSL